MLLKIPINRVLSMVHNIALLVFQRNALIGGDEGEIPSVYSPLKIRVFFTPERGDLLQTILFLHIPST
jgi:hypothetical protein